MKLQLNSSDCQDVINKIVSNIRQEEESKMDEDKRKLKDVTVSIYNTKASSFRIGNKSFQFETPPTFQEYEITNEDTLKADENAQIAKKEAHRQKSETARKQKEEANAILQFYKRNQNTYLYAG